MKLDQQPPWYVHHSDARTIIGEDVAELVCLWREKWDEVQPEDLLGNVLVQLGVITER